MDSSSGGEGYRSPVAPSAIVLMLPTSHFSGALSIQLTSRLFSPELCTEFGLTAFQQVEDNLSSLRILSQIIKQQDAAIWSAERNLKEATTRYKAGLDPYLNVINAQTLLLNSQ